MNMADKSAGDILQQLFIRHNELKIAEADILQAFRLLRSCFTAGGKLLLCGNGGSAADSEHIAGELMKGFLLPRPLTAQQQSLFAALPNGAALAQSLQGALPAIALCSHTALGTAILNDNGAAWVFAQQVWGYGQKGDCLFAMSTSGNSENIVAAAVTAKARGLSVIGMTGENGGLLRALCDVCLCLPARETYLVQELGLPVYHTLCAMLEAAFFA